MSYNYFNSGLSTDYRSGYAGAKKKPTPSPWADGVVPGMSAFSQGLVPSIQQGGSFMSYPPMHHRDNEEQMSAFMRNNTMGDMRSLYTRPALRRPLIQPGGRPVSKGVSFKKAHPLSSGLLQAMNFGRGKAQFAGRIANKKVRDNKSAKNNKVTSGKSDGFDENFDIPAQALKCLVCGKTSFKTLKGYIRHVKGKIHQDMLLLHQSRNDQYIKLLRTNALISNQKELKYADGPGRFCSLCQCTYLATGDAHRKNVEHILLKSQLVIRCCGKTMSISTIDEHRCSLQHLKMVHEKKQAVSDEQPPSDADEDILTDLAAEYDVLGTGVSATAAYNPSKVFGLSLLKRKKLYHCEPCNTTLPSKQRIESHCRSEGHYAKVVAFLKEHGEGEKKRKTKKPGSEKEKEAVHDASENAADEQTDEELVEEANRALNQITLEEFNATGLDESGHVGHDDDEDENAIDDSKESDDTGSESDDEADTADEDEEKEAQQIQNKSEAVNADQVEQNGTAATTKGEIKNDGELNHKPKVVQKESKKSEGESKDSGIKSERTKADSSSDEYAAAEEGLPSKDKNEKPKPKRSRKRASQPEEKAEVSSAGCKDQAD